MSQQHQGPPPGVADLLPWPTATTTSSAVVEMTSIMVSFISRSSAIPQAATTDPTSALQAPTYEKGSSVGSNPPSARQARVVNLPAFEKARRECSDEVSLATWNPGHPHNRARESKNDVEKCPFQQSQYQSSPMRLTHVDLARL